jgi:hypothetical protein
MKNIIFIILLIGTTVQLFGQINYAKKFGDKVLVFKFDTYNGPALITLQNGSKIDTVGYEPKCNVRGYHVYDTYVENDLILTVCSMPLWGAVAICYTKSNGKWKVNCEIFGIITRDDMKYSHEIDIIDKTHLKVINNGKEHICELDFAKKTFKTEKKN